MYTLNQGVTMFLKIEVHMGVMEKPFNKGVKSHLNLEPFSKMTSRGHG